jgi:ABC-2 type transport system permease protein
MSLLPVIARTECRLLVRRRGYGLLLGLFLLLAITSGVLNHARQTQTRVRQAAFQQLVRTQWLEQPDRHPHRVAHYGTFAFKPPGPLAAFDPGVEAYTGRIQYLEAHRQNAANFSEAGSLSSMFRLGDLSPAFLLQAVLPLVIIVLGHRALAEERESGRLALLRAQGASLRQLAWGKVGGLALALSPFALAGLAVAAVALGDDPAFLETADGGRRLLLILAASTVYTVSWLVLTVWISARARTAARACGILVTLWVLGCVVMPRAAGALGAALVPLPDKSSFHAAVAAEVRSLGDSHDPDDPHFAQLRAQTLARHGVTRVEDLPINYGAVVMAHGEALTAETFARHFAALGERMEAQHAWVTRASLLSPLIAFRALSSALAGTDLRAELLFQREAEAYRFRFVQQLNGLHRDAIRYQGDRDQRLSAETWKRFDDFRASAPPLAEALAGTGWSWAMLLLWAVWPCAALALTGRGVK